MEHDFVTTDRELEQLCDALRQVDTIAFDTEFVSEHTYRPQLCLVQVAWEGGLAVIDTLAVKNLRPFWEVLAGEGHDTIVHAGREEVGFSLAAVDHAPAELFDLQVAAGLIGLDYPAGYGSLVGKLLGQSPPKGETRTDWRKRPLSQHQIQYALSDVVHLVPMRDALVNKLRDLGRVEWMHQEMASWLEELTDSFRRERWNRVSGITSLSARSKAIVREVWRWREKEAQRRDMPPRRVLRDDLIVELAKRKVADQKRILSIRGMNRPELQRAAPDLAKCVKRALALPESELPKGKHRETLPSQFTVLGQFLSSALGSICRQEQLAPALVGNPTDIRELVAHRLGYRHEADDPPSLATGWRAEVVGSLIDDLLAGKLAVRVGDPRNEHPLVLERNGDKVTR